MRAAELVLWNYKEYYGTKSYLVKRAFVVHLIKRLDNEGCRFLLMRSNGWMTMSDKQKHVKFTKKMINLNKPTTGRVKVKPSELAVKLNKQLD